MIFAARHIYLYLFSLHLSLFFSLSLYFSCFSPSIPHLHFSPSLSLFFSLFLSSFFLRSISLSLFFLSLLPFHPQLSALWPLIVLRAIVLVACVENLVALEPQNAYNADERALDWLIFDRVAAVPFALAEAALRAACAHVEDEAKVSAEVSAQISSQISAAGMAGNAAAASLDPLTLPLTGAGAGVGAVGMPTSSSALAVSAPASTSSSAVVNVASPSVQLSAAAQHVAQWLDALPHAHSSLPPTAPTMLAV